MLTKWTKGLDEDRTKEVEAQYSASAPLRKRMIEVLEADVNALQTSMLNEELFDSPNWQLIQADRLAQMKALRKIISLLGK